MRVREVSGWPPSKYDSAAKPREDCGNEEPQAFVLKSACYVNGHTPQSPDGVLLMVVVDSRTGEECTARLRISDPELGRKMAEVLAVCKGLPLAQAGNLKLKGD
jgi:hypothetical protein